MIINDCNGFFCRKNTDLGEMFQLLQLARGCECDFNLTVAFASQFWICSALSHTPYEVRIIAASFRDEKTEPQKVCVVYPKLHS